MERVWRAQGQSRRKANAIHTVRRQHPYKSSFLDIDKQYTFQAAILGRNPAAAHLI